MEINKIKTEKLMKTKVCTLNDQQHWQTVNQIDQQRRKNTQIIRIRNERGTITNKLTETKKIVKEYYKQLHTNKLDNLDKMDKFLEKLPKLTQENLQSKQISNK